MTSSLGSRYFEGLYAGDPDPWGYASSAYEAAKYAATCDALPPVTFRRGFEIGCSFGVLSRAIATRCETLLAVDLVQVVLDRARQDAGDHANIIFERMEIPRDWPAGEFDLIVLSEMLYYLSPSDLERTAALAGHALSADGVVVLVNWLGDTGVPQSGDGAAEAFIRAMRPGVSPVLQSRAPQYRLDMLAR